MQTRNIIQINDFKSQFPKCYDAYLKCGGNNYKSLNLALDSLLNVYGIGIIVPPVYSETDKFLGYISIIKYYPSNSLNIESGETTIIEDFKKYKTPFNPTKITTLKALSILENALQ